MKTDTILHSERLALAKRWATIVLLIVCTAIGCSAAGEETPVKVGIAWQQSADNFVRAIKAVKAAGGVPVILDQMRPAGLEYDGTELQARYMDANGILLQRYADMVKRETYHGTDIAQKMQGIQAVVFLGGGDISPTLFAQPEPWHGIEAERNYQTTRDLSEYLTMTYCLDNNIPILGLCRGMQMLAVVSGAPLIQDLGAYYHQLGKEDRHVHRAARDAQGKRHYTPHNVTVTDTTSLLYAITHTHEISNVPSWHHQAVGDITGTPLRVTAVTSDDGIDVIEAIERCDQRFALGVQYHPEEAVRKHIDKASDAARFMPMDEAVKYFKALIMAAGRIIKGKAYTLDNPAFNGKTADECYMFFAVLGKAEQGSPEGAEAELSLLLNLFESRHPDAVNPSIQEVAQWATDCGWFAHAARRWETTAGPEYVAMAHSVLAGNRVMPSFILEHDCIEDLAYIETDGIRYSPYQKDKYVSGKTVCYQAPVHEHNGRKFGFRKPSHWTFYSFPTAKSDPFGYLCGKDCPHHNVTDANDIVR